MLQITATPNQGLKCKDCGEESAQPHKTYKLVCDPCGRKRQVEYQRKYRDRQKALARKVICKGCGCEFDTARNGRAWRCHECLLAYQREIAAKDRDRHAQYSRNYRSKMGDKYREKMTMRRAEMLAGMTPEQQAQFRQAEADKSKRLNAIAREAVFQAYGGYKCACCGETEKMFLSIDHINNDGAQMRRDGVHKQGGSVFYQWLRRNKFPAGFQVLCMNCNLGKHRNGGVCPHLLIKA